MNRMTYIHLSIATTCLLVTVGLFTYTYHLIAREEVKLAEQLTAIKTGSERKQILSRLESVAADSAPERAELSQYFLPNTGESIAFLTTVESLAPQYGVTLKTDALQEGNDEQNKQQWVEVTFTFSGIRANVENFIALLEHLPYFLHIMSVQLTALDEGDWQARVELRVFTAGYEN